MSTSNSRQLSKWLCGGIKVVSEQELLYIQALVNLRPTDDITVISTK